MNASKSSATDPGSGRGIAEELEQLRLALLERKGVELAIDASAPPAPELSEFFRSLKEEFDAIGWNQALELVERHITDPFQCAVVLAELGKLCRAQNPFVALELGRKAHALDPGAFGTKWLSFVAYDAGHITEAVRLLGNVRKEAPLQGSEVRTAAQIEGFHRMLAEEPAVPRPWPRAYEAVPRTLLYVTSSCQPFHLSGYTVRTQALLKAAAGTDWKVVCVVRPGYPWDSIGPTVTAAPSVRSAGVDYRFIRGAHISAMPPDAYITAAATLIESKARELKPAIIQAASNHFTALPALIAARRLGVPFIYEVRGLGEIAASAGKDGWERSERFQLASRLEALAASNADAVFTLSRQLSRELQNRGVAARRIHLLPNGADVELFAAERDRGLLAGLGLDPDVFTIGYAGGIKFYEGLDDLLEAVAHLHRQGKRAQAVIVGDGTHLPALSKKVSALQLGHAIRFVGPQPQPIAHAYLRAADAAVVPRKRLAVSETVPPLKPFEAMAVGTPLIMSDVGPLADIVRDGGAAVLFEASNATSLATQIVSLMEDSARRSELIARGREYVATRSSWAHVGQKMAAVLDEVDRQARSQSSAFFSGLKRTSRFIQRVVRGEETESERQRTAADIALLSTSGLFDASWYLRRYPDVIRARMNPFEHYLRHGAAEGRDPGPAFSTALYLASHPDCNGTNPLLHHLRHGQPDGPSSAKPNRAPN